MNILVLFIFANDNVEKRGEVMENYYHLFANGDDAKNFITSERDFKAAFNRFAICSQLSGAIVMSASVEDSHPHVLLKGCFEKCNKFKTLYEAMSLKFIVSTRGSSDGVNLHCELYEIFDEQYLRNVAAYTIVQATKDGKAVMPYDYYYGTGALYFRKPWSILPWVVDMNGSILTPVTISSLTFREKRLYFPSSVRLPDDWLVCNGIILPTNYVDIKGYEAIFSTHNCFRAFLCSGKSRDEVILSKMAGVRGVLIEDLDARKFCEQECMDLFGKHTTRHLNPQERILLGQTLRNKYQLSYRQLSTLIKIPESELRKYIK